MISRSNMPNNLGGISGVPIITIHGGILTSGHLSQSHLSPHTQTGDGYCSTLMLAIMAVGYG